MNREKYMNFIYFFLKFMLYLLKVRILCMKEKIKIILYCFAISFLFLFIATKSSPIYPLNDWGDANAFFTMGKGFINGMVPFKDLFEQKGPVLYVIYGIGYLLSNTTFLGVFIMEVVAFTVVLYYFYKILKLYQMEKLFYHLSPIFSASILSMFAFSHGGSAEEFCLPLIMISLYHFLFLIKDKEYLKENKKVYIVTGIIAGLALWIKYTFLGFWIAFGLIFSFLFLYEKKYQNLFSFCAYYLLGILIITLPILLYFFFHNALKDLWDVYFYFNIFLYRPSLYESNFLLDLGFKAYRFFLSLINNNFFTVFLLLGILFIVKDKKILLKKYKVLIAILFIFSYSFSFFGGSFYKYYFLILGPFALFGVLLLGKYFSKASNKLSILTIAFCFMFILITSDKIDFSKVKKESLAQFKFATIMNEEENPTMLYYGGIDGGFYTVSNILPNEKYFEKVNVSYLSYSDNLDSQMSAIKNKRVQFVVFRIMNVEEKKEIPYLNENYELISMQIQEYEDKEWKYLLYKLK